MNRIPLHRHSLTFVILFHFALCACGKKEGIQKTAPKGMPDNALPVEEIVPRPANGISPSNQSREHLNDAFRHENLLGLLGKEILPEMMEKIETAGQGIPELNDLTGKGSRGYVVGLHSGGGTSLQVADGHLVVFGYSYRGSETSDVDEDHYLSGFKFSREESVNVLDDNFNKTSMRVMLYKSIRSNTIEAVFFARGSRRTLAFYDSTRVDMKKLLPASPESIDPAVLENLRALAHPQKQTAPGSGKK